MTLRKFDYPVDPSHKLLQFAAIADTHLSTLCPVLVGKLRAVADSESNASLFLASQKAGSVMQAGELFMSLIGPDNLPEEMRANVAEAVLILEVSVSILARRYSDGTLEPELHIGGKAAAAWALSQVEPIAEESDADRLPANGTSDGIV